MNIVAKTEKLKQEFDKHIVPIIDDIHNGLEEKRELLNDIEPDDDGSKHDQWEDRCDSLDDLIDDAEELKEVCKRFALDVDMHQAEYGGLKK